jgi:hypothetical protein
MRSLAVTTVAAALLAGTGCATVAKMPLQVAGRNPDLSKNGLLVARVHVRNENHPTQQPELFCWFATKTIAGKEEAFSFTEPTLLADEAEKGKDYFASMSFEPGPIRLDSVLFRRYVPLLMSAMASAPVNATVQVTGGKVTYLGRIEAVIVPKTSDAQPAAGSVIPLIDQSVAGFSNGTWQLKVTDGFDEDVAALKRKHKFLASKEFVKSLLELPVAPPAAVPPAPPAAADEAEPQASN